MARIKWLILALLLVALAVGGIRWGTRQRETDMAAVHRANNRGIGYMDQFDYSKAIEAFEEAARLAPDWLPGKINLGIALLYQSGRVSGTDPHEPGSREQTAQRAINLFEDIRARQSADSWVQPHANFCLGLLHFYSGRSKDARPYFERVTQFDPNDGDAWFQYGRTIEFDNPEEATRCFHRALEYAPYHKGALYAVAQQIRETDPKKADALLAEFIALDKARAFDWQLPYREVGKYAQLIGRSSDSKPAVRTGPIPLFEKTSLTVTLDGGTRWAKTEELPELLRAVRQRFGGVIVALDFNGDGKPDLFLLGAVTRNDKLGNLLLRNDGDGRFTDVTTEAGLGRCEVGLGCVAADFNNDGATDLLVTTASGVRLFRNNRKEVKFDDVTEEAGLREITGVCLGAAFVDLDQDGDLDLIVCRYADDAAGAMEQFAGKGEGKAGSLAVYLNIGEAKPATVSDDPPPLPPRFRKVKDEECKGLLAAGPHVTLAFADVDQDRDLDLVLLIDRQPPVFGINDRLLRFRRVGLPEKLAGARAWRGLLALDVNRDERSDLLLLSDTTPVCLLRQDAEPGQYDRAFTPATVQSPVLLQAQAIDLDLDGWVDVVGLSEDRKPVLLHNEGGRLIHDATALGVGWPGGLIAVHTADFTGDGNPDLLLWSDGGLELRTNRGNGHRALVIDLYGHRRCEGGGDVVRCNLDGFGTWVTAHSAAHVTGLEYVTLSAGLGQSRLPLILGLGKHSHADVVRLRWPDNCWQAEFNIPSNTNTRVEEANRKQISCPILFAWNGQRFEFVTDFLGAGSVGEMLASGGTRPPRPEESVKIEAHQLQPRNGRTMMKIAVPMDEITYLDRLQLLVLDHPREVSVYPDERFCDPPPSQDLLAFRERVFPAKATTHRGRDVTATLREWDRDTVGDFRKRSWIGFAEEHAIELDFGDRLSQFKLEDRLVLCLAGWTDYAYPESIWAASQAGVTMLAPQLERLDHKGQWQLVAEAGFPAGLPRMMTLDVTGKLTGPSCRLRLRTNLHVHWDQIYVAPLLERRRNEGDGLRERTAHLRVTPLEVDRATLAPRGCMLEYSPDGKLPTVYDYDRLSPIPATAAKGKWTRFGDVTELLTERDDCFVIFGPGDELDVQFDATKLPPLPEGWTRSFVLRTWGYCKDCAPFTAHGDTVEPLPFHAMKAYPPGPNERYPDSPKYRDYLRKYNTRRMGR
jgi:tetratricopeptide (TPR) repeat protein